MSPLFSRGRRIAKLPSENGTKTHPKAVIFIYLLAHCGDCPARHFYTGSAGIAKNPSGLTKIYPEIKPNASGYVIKLVITKELKISSLHSNTKNQPVWKQKMQKHLVQMQQRHLYSS
jgi:hypothetical protein